MLSNTSECQEPVHIELDWYENKILSVCEKEDECHPDAQFWLPDKNFRRVEVYCSISKIDSINTKEHFTRLIASRIVQEIERKQQ